MKWRCGSSRVAGAVAIPEIVYDPAPIHHGSTDRADAGVFATRGRRRLATGEVDPASASNTGGRVLLHPHRAANDR
jgi:hypothetical protein